MHWRLRRLMDRITGGGTPSDIEGEAPPGWYDEIYRESDSFNGHYRKSHYYFSWCLIADRLRAADWPAVLEVGCGPGQLARLLIDQGLPVYSGFDFSPRAIATAREALPCREVWVGDAREAGNYGRVPFDAIVCTEVLEHVEADTSIVALWPVGKLVIATVPSFDYPSHVRTFASAEAVRERYGQFFEVLDVTSWPSPKGEDRDRFYLMQGVRV